MLTGRHESLRETVLQVLHDVGIFPHQLIMKPTADPTPPFKQAVVSDLLRRHPHVTSVHVRRTVPRAGGVVLAATM